MYSVYVRLRDEKGVTDAIVAKATGIGKSTFSDWKTGRSVPKNEKLKKIADYFGVSINYLLTGETTPTEYYLNADAREVAQFLFEHPEYKVLFDASRKVKKEDLQIVKELLDRFGG